MVYVMEIYTDGGCRGNGRPGAIGAAAAVFVPKYGRNTCWTDCLPQYPPPTSQRAEIQAIILALEKALSLYHDLDNDPRLDVTVYSDSRYAVGCMSQWIYKWVKNGWINSAGNDVANQDLLKKASDLDDDLRDQGKVEYVWIPRDKNQDADRLCNEVLDDQSPPSPSSSSSSSSYY
ncbi:ribonuclease H1 [Penicillium cosmopolitanum]|uniref:Ribonuclease H1 n=1 Tax=Penicillium cosmopolitanum TaxID=1131564 RepID=A0A9W9W4M9_9EURO|nr:ribonuclease H1 [Penicillium cosmopolitanum]KAJ5403419.1 ribonuclease H1 [Penicillium cosmopolitanum]